MVLQDTKYVFFIFVAMCINTHICVEKNTDRGLRQKHFLTFIVSDQFHVQKISDI